MTTTLFTLANTNLANGTRAIPVTALGANAAIVQARLARNTSNSSTLWASAAAQVALTAQFSFDGGSSYPLAVAWQDTGGIRTTKGVQLDYSQLTMLFNAPYPTHVKGSIVVSNGPCRTLGDVRVN